MSLTYHDYTKEKEIAVDIEGKDPNLKTKGNGVYRKDGHIVGVSFSNGDLSEYYPTRHPDTTPQERHKNEQYIQDQLDSNTSKIFANGIYDLDWLINHNGWKVGGGWHDVQIAAPLLDEYKRSYSLDTLGKEYIGQGKSINVVRDYAIKQGWIKESSKSTGVEHLWRMPYDAIKSYPADDTLITYKVMQEERKELKKQSLEEVYDLEMSLFPMLLQMRKTGVRIDESKLHKTGIYLSDLRFELQEELDKLSGFEINVNSGKQLEKLFLKFGLEVQYNEPTERMVENGNFKGNPQFDKATLGTVDHKLAQKILELRHISTLLSLFIVPYPDLIVDGRLHCQFNQLRSDNYGTVSGRFSSSNPNLQQVSGEDEDNQMHSDSEILNGLIVRKLFIPEEYCIWGKLDWSQIEYRLIAHYAIGEGAEEIRRRYNEDPNTDYHDEVGKMADLTDRKVIKTLNFGKAYSMGVRTMAKKYGWDYETAKAINEQYDRKLPFVKETSRRVTLRAKSVGFVRTILGRRARVQNINKAYVMFNRLIQGGAADLMKKAMVESHKRGIFNTLFPHIIVHDEFDVSVPKTKEGTEALKELKYTMENCVKLKVPIIADVETGNNWGELEEFKG